MKVKILSIGHAGFLLKTEDVNILIDPWFYPAFFNTWFPYPNNRFMEDVLLNEKIDYLYLSHEHEDHFDKKFLSKFDKDVKIICADFPSPILIDELDELGFKNLICLGHEETFDIDDKIKCKMFLDNSHSEDSALLIDFDGFKFLDINDCQMNLKSIPKVDLMTCQYSNASWFPQCYNYDKETMKTKISELNDILKQKLVDKVKHSSPRYFIPSASPCVFLNPSMFHFVEGDTTFLKWRDDYWPNSVDAFFKETFPNIDVVELSVGNSINIDDGIVEDKQTIYKDELNLINLKDYSDARKDEWDVDYESTIDVEKLNDYFKKLISDNLQLVLCLTKNKRFIISCNDKNYLIKLNHRIDKLVKEVDDDFYEKTKINYRIKIPSMILNKIINLESDWETALLSMKIELNRKDDVYDSDLFILLRSGHKPTQTKKYMSLSKKIDNVKMMNKGGYTFNRYCPHAGEDLVEVDVIDNCITCPRHHWKWDLNTGKCIRGGNINLTME